MAEVDSHQGKYHINIYQPIYDILYLDIYIYTYVHMYIDIICIYTHGSIFPYSSLRSDKIFNGGLYHGDAWFDPTKIWGWGRTHTYPKRIEERV